MYNLHGIWIRFDHSSTENTSSYDINVTFKVYYQDGDSSNSADNIYDQYIG